MNMNIIRQLKSCLLTILYEDKKNNQGNKNIKEQYFRHKKKKYD